MVNQIYYYNSDKFLSIEKDYRNIKTRAENITHEKPKTTTKDSLFAYAFKSLPPVRRISSLPDKMDKGDYLPALELSSLALINLPEDIRDIQSAVAQIKGAKPLYDYKNYQHNFSFLRGTAIEKWLHGEIESGKKWAKWLYRNDKTLADTNLGYKILDLVKAKEQNALRTTITDFNGIKVKAVKYGGNLFAELTGRALRRTTKLGLIALALVEAPKILKKMFEGKNIFEQGENALEQTAKSTVNIASIAAGIGYGGAIGSKYGGSIGSLIGMGFGAILGSKVSKNIQDKI